MPGKAIRVRGIVQGVGFRPAIWRLATRHGLVGAVWNDAQGVTIHAWGETAQLQDFIAQIPQKLPPLARLDSLEAQDLDAPPDGDAFRIVASKTGAPPQTPVSADAATCPDCLAEIFDPGNRRYRYPFTNCTHCGPRLSIIKGIPYDRCNTAMAEFTMCPACRREYENPADRRFHAQANCCPVCGPVVWLEDRDGLPVVIGKQGESLFNSPHPGLLPEGEGGRYVLTIAAELIRQGRIIAIKGLGGFHLACNAADEQAVDTLRQRKRRYAKPFALMAKDAATIARYAQLTEQALQALHSPAAPIVLLPAQGERLAASVAPGLHELGFMLPYTPLHALLLENLDMPLVMTSGNISDEPQCLDNDEARQQLAEIADYFLLHDRAIVNRLDDSVLHIIAGKVRLLRRARGYCPEALPLPPGFENAGAVLAMGAELKNTFCLLHNGQAVVSQHNGDLENAAVQRGYRNSLDLYRGLHAFEPAAVAVDYHPGYLSTQLGQTIAAEEGLALQQVQHHHAHLAACLLEYGKPLDAPPVLGAIFDGLGMGENGELWGGEFLLCGYAGFTRLGHLEAVALPGGAQAMREPWRNLYAQLRHYYDWDNLQCDYADLEIIRFLAGKPLATLDTMLRKNLNSPLSSSCGRWFDACAALLGLHHEQAAYEGQAAIALESLAAQWLDGGALCSVPPYPYAILQKEALAIIGWQPFWPAVLDELQCGTDKTLIAARMHRTLAAATVELLLELSRRTTADSIVLSGGVFQNRLLLETVTNALQAQGKTVLAPRQYPMNDGGIALGQAAVAAARALTQQ